MHTVFRLVLVLVCAAFIAACGYLFEYVRLRVLSWTGAARSAADGTTGSVRSASG